MSSTITRLIVTRPCAVIITSRMYSKAKGSDAVLRDYQPYKNNKYLLPQPLYRMTLAFVRDYPRKLAEYNNIVEASPPPPDGQPRPSAKSAPTERDGIRRAELGTSIKAIETALATVPAEYQKGVWENIILYKRYPDDADPRTYRRYKQKFIYYVAHNMFWV